MDTRLGLVGTRLRLDTCAAHCRFHERHLRIIDFTIVDFVIVHFTIVDFVIAHFAIVDFVIVHFAIVGFV